MPTEIYEDGFEVAINTDDHLSAHVPVRKAGTECRILIGTPAELPASLWDNKGGMREKDLKIAILLVAREQVALYARWREIHG